MRPIMHLIILLKVPFHQIYTVLTPLDIIIGYERTISTSLLIFKDSGDTAVQSVTKNAPPLSKSSQLPVRIKIQPADGEN